MARKKTTKAAKKVEAVVVKETVVVEETPVVEETVVVEETPVVEETVVVEEAPVAEETAAVEEASVAEEVKKAPAKKAPAKKATKKATLTTTVTLQFAEKSYTEETLTAIAKDVWKYDLNQEDADLKTVELYVKPEEGLCYYVFNGDVTGSFVI